jgi:outer membrane protein TolC
MTTGTFKENHCGTLGGVWRTRAPAGSRLFRAGVLALSGMAACAAAQTPAAIDLPTALQLAGANSLDVQIARERVAEARAAGDAVRARFFPFIAPSVVVRRHDDNIQTVSGPIIDADRQSLAAGIALHAQVDVGETYYQTLVARQLVRSNEAAFAGRQREMTFRAATGYFELTRARAAVIAAEEAARISWNHAQQITATAEAGLTFQGDAARVRAARERADLTLERVRTEQRIAAARLAELLRLDPAVELTPSDADLAPLSVVRVSRISSGEELGALVAQALATRPELDEAAARVSAARLQRRAATNAPLIPTIGAQAALGGLGGGPGGSTLTRDWGATGDYSFGVSWRIGPGGLFDRNRQREAAARERQVEFAEEKVRDSVRRQVVEQYARLRSYGEQIELARKSLEAAEQTARLSRQRRDTGVSAVLEDLQAEEELARARREYLTTVSDYNLAQYALRYATGD